ncbi:adenine phosphoribosyltransferase [Herbiconiux sp. L3-i23]|uniref:adenine phosphoribosyltransferase n=1 Tax=Herbiconiux sp. L3-i23 TaxID=2905871 RepID=UPI00204638A1|nr:adenine phosphoribosyltransferase [Herbiconiux sp. L3-i23]BDI22142.1 adenine phosphoribosyltransferase [Herbiconiux sp. L3-i23]
MQHRTPAEIVRSSTTLTPDFPEQGILFRDLSPLFADADAFRSTVEALAEPFGGDFTLVAGAEARGFVLAAGLAVATGTGALPIRKAGKLPPPVLTESYDLEYGSASLQLVDGLVAPQRVLLIDDVLATGGTLAASRRLLERAGHEVVGIGVVIELPELRGRDALPGIRVHALLSE